MHENYVDAAKSQGTLFDYGSLGEAKNFVFVLSRPDLAGRPVNCLRDVLLESRQSSNVLRELVSLMGRYTSGHYDPMNQIVARRNLFDIGPDGSIRDVSDKVTWTYINPLVFEEAQGKTDHWADQLKRENFVSIAEYISGYVKGGLTVANDTELTMLERIAAE